MSGELEKVLPLEDAEKLGQAKPITPNGEVKLDPAKVEARHDAQVRMAFKQGPVAAVILGGAHNLTDSASRFTGGGCEYLRVTTKRFRKLSNKGVGSWCRLHTRQERQEKPGAKGLEQC